MKWVRAVGRLDLFDDHGTITATVIILWRRDNPDVGRRKPVDFKLRKRYRVLLTSTDKEFNTKHAFQAIEWAENGGPLKKIKHDSQNGPPQERSCQVIDSSDPFADNQEISRS